jgi:hypothetical protein
MVIISNIDTINLKFSFKKIKKQSHYFQQLPDNNTIVQYKFYNTIVFELSTFVVLMILNNVL